MTGRYDLLDLSLVPPPDAVRVLDFDTTYATWLAQFANEAALYGYTYNVQRLRSDPAGWAMRTGAYRELYKRAEVNDAVKAVLLATATGADLDNVCADLRVVRQTLAPADLTTTPVTTAVMESDDSLRLRRALAPEALSVAGPGGAYLFYAYDAHPDVKGAGIYGPENGVGVPDGHVWMVILSRSGVGGAPSQQVLQAVASHICAWDADIPNYVRPSPAQLDANTLRPNTAWVSVKAATIVPYTVSGILRIPPGADGEVLRQAAQARILAYANLHNVVGVTHTRDSLIAAGRMLNADGSSPVNSFTLLSPATDINPGPLGAAYCSTLVSLSVEVSDG